MNILLINPPNCGRNIPEERYGITSLKQILRGEPLGLEMLAGSLRDHEVKIADLKVEAESLSGIVAKFSPDLVGITGMTCEANTVLTMASQIKENTGALVVVGGIHASNDPAFFNRPFIDFISVGLGNPALSALVDALSKWVEIPEIPGIIPTRPGQKLVIPNRKFGAENLMDAHSPAYDLVGQYRKDYFLPTLGLAMGHAVSAFGCPYRCHFCAIRGQAGGQYLTRSASSVVRDISLLDQTPVIRLVDANTFGRPDHARQLCRAIVDAGIRKNFIIDIRADSVVREKALLKEWKAAGLKAVVIGFEGIEDHRLKEMNKQSRVSSHIEAIKILKDLGISIVGDFIIDPESGGAQFDAFETFIQDNAIELPCLPS